MKRKMLGGEKKFPQGGLLHNYDFYGNVNDNTGLVHGSALNVAYQLRNGVQSAYFNGINSVITFPSNLMPVGNAIRTINIWAEPLNAKNVDLGLFGGNGQYLGFSIIFNPTQFYIWHGVGDVGMNIATTGLNMWTYRFYGGLVTNADLYKNGVYVGRVSLLAGRDGNMNTSTGYNQIGHRPKIASWDPAEGFRFEGYLAHFGIWNRLLTQEEITNLYNKGKGLSYEK